MMEKLNHIEETTLPLALNFEALKEMGLAYIQKHNDSTWTNLNPSDPGVTILDQVCYAFTELGYCNDFPIKDILTNREGELEVKNQFYLPENILTTSPITIQDIRKYVVDQVEELVNLQITPVKSSINGIYEVEVLIDPKINKDKEITITYLDAKGNETEEEKTQEELILNNTFFVLNTCRNLGELFLYPTSLKQEKYPVYGTLEIAADDDVDTVVVAIEHAINNYVFPEIVQVGYEELKIEGKTTSEIFNGPKLENGWISNKYLCPKKNTVQAFELVEVIQKIPGVLSITNVGFNEKRTLLEVKSDKKSEILVFDFIQCVEKDKKVDINIETSNEENSGAVYNVEIFRKEKQLNQKIKSAIIQDLSYLDEPEEQISRVTTVVMQPKLPKGNYRDIASYFSIQNTFPEVYGVGVEGVSAGATAFQIAQSRQLKGYLTLFDQALTNQFMQLANVGTLFSFENSITGDPTDRNQFYSVQTIFEKKHSKYPVPYLCFSPTYFYQSLYEEVPYIRPLLRNFKKHNFSFTAPSPQLKEYESWTTYKHDPYNSYAWGLMYFMENETENIKRRNTILNHLLARHGESPEVIDTIIAGNIYSGNYKKDQVIIKSLYLQNLGILSYYKTKAYNFIGASFLKTKYIDNSGELPPKFYDKLQEKLVERHQKDFLFKTVEINKALQLKSSDVINFSGIELKLNLLFSLNAYYQDYLTTHNDAYAYWLIKRRKGFLCIETDLLKASANYEIILKEETGEFYRIVKKHVKDKLVYNDVFTIEALLKKEGCTSEKFKKIYALAPTVNKHIKEDDFRKIRKTSYQWDVQLIYEDEFQIPITDPLFNNELIFVFPSFFKVNKTFKISDFEKRLKYFLQEELPVQVCYEEFYLKNWKLKDCIIAYAAWYNSLRFNQENGKLHGPDLAGNTMKLINVLRTLKSKEE